MRHEKPVQLYSIKQCAKMLCISEKSLRRMVNQRRIDVVRINRRVLISDKAIKSFIDKQTIFKVDTNDFVEKFSQ